MTTTDMFYKSINFWRIEFFKSYLRCDKTDVYREFCLLMISDYRKEYREYRKVMRTSISVYN